VGTGADAPQHSFVYLVVHVVFSTRDRAPHLTPELSGRMFPYMAGIVKALQGVPFIVNGPADHVHLLLSLPAGVSISEMLRVLKANSSRWVHEQFPELRSFGWQSGYGAFSVSCSRLDEVKKYIAGQQAHHRKVSFEGEFLSLLRKHGMDCEPQGALRTDGPPYAP
jgi:REP element-mobilizing transposase RayT